ncbi:hypothetical protein CR155_20505 [Pollutimonas nitritireducens]|uniref:Uncharacterized protein n=1 Tax=Pollutimonas nitritireducens TaxID=2045209 RepID=A0A2N4UAE3_9BURK|nr:hypothetical protein [Pollutimonas nitritireducens]PLC51990.1 hypothetical protein CR155_20505 [Pollutimonas nitritireducens]
MPKNVARDGCLAEIKRFFKYYFSFCESPDPDAVREAFASAYSLNDKLRKAGYPNFFRSKEFLAIKAVRNYAIHEAEIYNKTRSLPLASTVPIGAELSILCLIPKRIMEQILDGCSEDSVIAIKDTCVFYRDYVDIYPSMFNFGVQLFLYTETHSFKVDSKEYAEFANSIEYERINNYPHFVVGGFKLPQGGCVDEFIEVGLSTIDEKIIVQNTFYSEDKGMFTFKGF